MSLPPTVCNQQVVGSNSSDLLFLEALIVGRDAPSFPENHFDRPVSLGGGLSAFPLLRFNNFFFLVALTGVYRIEGACPEPLAERGVRIGNNSIAASVAGAPADPQERRHHQIAAHNRFFISTELHFGLLLHLVGLLSLAYFFLPLSCLRLISHGVGFVLLGGIFCGVIILKPGTRSMPTDADATGAERVGSRIIPVSLSIESLTLGMRNPPARQSRKIASTRRREHPPVSDRNFQLFRIVTSSNKGG